MTEKKAEKVSKHFELDELYWFLGRKGTSEIRENVYLITIIGQNPRLIVGFDVAFDKSPDRIQKIVDSSPEADFYYTDGYMGLSIPENTYAIFVIKKTLTILKV